MTPSVATLAPPAVQAPSPPAWPEDYLRWDEGRLLVRPDCADAFRRLGWTTLAAMLQADNVDVVRRVAQRDNCRVVLPCASGNVHGYLKRHSGLTIAEWLQAQSLGVSRTPGLREAEGVAACQRVGVGVPEILAAGGKVGSTPTRSPSFFLSEAITDSQPADDYWRSHLESLPSNDRRRLSLIDALADAARRFHEAGLFHRDFYWCHFFVRETGSPSRPFEVRLIDLQRVLRQPAFASRWKLKDAAQFVFSMPPTVAESERHRWLGRYLGGSTGRFRLTGAAIRIRAEFYRLKEDRR